MNRYDPRNSLVRGFALLEVLISFVVLAVGLLALLGFHNASQTNVGQAKSTSEAVQLAEGKLQELESFHCWPVDDTHTAYDVHPDGYDCDTRFIDGSQTGITGVNTTYDMEWNVSGTERKTVAITVTWDHDNDPATDDENYVLVSNIDFTAPSESAENIVEVFRVTDDIRRNYENPPGGASWGTGTSGEGISGDREVVETLEGEPSTDPLDGSELENTYIFAITVSGSITRSGGSSSDVTIEDPSATAVNSLTTEGATYEPTCTSSNKSYSCRLYYSTAGDPPGWVGTITIKLGKDDVFCSVGDPSPGTWSTRIYHTDTKGNDFIAGDLSFSNSGLLENKTFNIEIASGQDNCPTQS